jgi:hypothetical protein
MSPAMGTRTVVSSISSELLLSIVSGIASQPLRNPDLFAIPQKTLE